MLVEGDTVLGSCPAEVQRHVRDRHFIDKTEMAMCCIRKTYKMKCSGAPNAGLQIDFSPNLQKQTIKKIEDLFYSLSLPLGMWEALKNLRSTATEYNTENTVTQCNKIHCP